MLYTKKCPGSLNLLNTTVESKRAKVADNLVDYYSGVLATFSAQSFCIKCSRPGNAESQGWLELVKLDNYFRAGWLVGGDPIPA